MTPEEKGPPRLGNAAGPIDLSFPGGNDLQATSTRQATAQDNKRLRRQRLVEHLHRLGPSPLGHFLNEVELGASVADHLERYRRIDPEFVRALGVDRYAPIVHVIDGGERGKGGAP
jgi:hypothetical protein